jgi:hypothetical protein
MADQYQADMELVWQTVGDELHSEHPAHAACERIRARIAELDPKLASYDMLVAARAEANARVAELEQQQAERAHLEEGARILTASHELGLVRDTAYGAALDRWLTAERARKATSGGG